MRTELPPKQTGPKIAVELLAFFSSGFCAAGKVPVSILRPLCDAHKKLFKTALLVPPVTKIARKSKILCLLRGMSIFLFSLQAGSG